MAEGAVSFLLNHLSLLLNEERHLLGGLKGEVVSIHDEMLQMREFLRVADANEDSNVNLKEWIRQLREISYDVEDVLDKYMFRFGRHTGMSGFRGCMKSFYGLIRKLKARHLIASEIQAIKYRLENVSKSQQRYREMMCDVVDPGSTLRNELFDGRGNALFLEDDDVVGIEKPKEQLIEWIGSMDDGVEVISVVGMGGVGKTTLVKKVYDDESVKRRFDQHVWVVASDHSDVEHLLANLIKKLVEGIKKLPPQGLEEMSVDEMRNFIYEFLKDKKYIIILDDVWNISVWEAIRYTLPKRGVRGCIIVSTRFNHIGNAVCTETNHVYYLQPLPIQESEVLFYKKAFPVKSCPHNLRKFAQSSLRRCQGLPLAIVVIGGLLATKDYDIEEWEMFSRSLGHELKDGSLQVLGKILSLSYNDLPYYLKYCYLYLSIFPEYELLEKEKIIRLWMAEGLLQFKQHKTMEEVAGDYLNELFSRSLIQIAERHYDGRARAFRIHDLLRDYIISKSREHNIVTICNGGEMQWPSRIRRVSIQKSFSFSQRTYNFECLRSLTLMCSENTDIGMINELVSKCRLLKVLDLRGAPLETIPKGVFKLYHLKYLCLRNTVVSLISKSIGSLKKLETLDLKNCNVTEVPIEILKLHKLRHLLVYKRKSILDFSFHNTQSCKAPCNIGSSLPLLVKLSCVDANESDGVKMVREIGKLTHLRRLGIVKLRSEDGKELCSSIAKLSDLRSLRIDSFEEGEKLEVDYPITLPFLRTLVLNGCLVRVPEWIQSLDGLTTLVLGWSRLREDMFKSLQNLSNLSCLTINGAYVEGLKLGAHGFPKLKVLSLRDLKFMKAMRVEKGCMPALEKLYVQDCPMLKELPQGLEHLINLRYIGFGNMTMEFVENVIEAQRIEKADWRLASVRVVFHIMIEGARKCHFAL